MSKNNVLVAITASREKEEIVYRVESSSDLTNEEFEYYLSEIISGICKWKKNICKEDIHSYKRNPQRKKETNHIADKQKIKVNATEAVHEISEILAAMTVEVENKAFELIVKYQPVASDLRIINSYMKIAYDFERYGRYAWDISFTHKQLTGLDKCAMCNLLVSQFLERIADHTTYIGEAIVYISTGEKISLR